MKDPRFCLRARCYAYRMDGYGYCAPHHAAQVKRAAETRRAIRRAKRAMR